ncbi:MAG: hypothetical protein WKG32_19660 [Gemmatimonadaceae bacterium]
MSGSLAPAPLADAHLALSAGIALWNVILAGRIARWRDAPRPIALLTALAGLLIVPALFIAVTSASLLTGRAMHSVAWVWPLTTAVIAAQALYSVHTRRVPRLTGVPIAAYDVIVMAAALAHYALERGAALPSPFLALVAAQATALEVGADPATIVLPLYLYVPILAPAISARRRRTVLVIRGLLAGAAAAWATLVLVSLPGAIDGVRRYARYAAERLQERSQGDFIVGLKLFPTLTGDGPTALAVTSDLDLATSMDAQALSVYVAPGQVTLALLDSLARTLDESRRGGKPLIVALDAPDDLGRSRDISADAYLAARVAEVDRITRRLRPDYLVPGLARAGARRRIPLARWTRYLADAAVVAHSARPRTVVVAHVPSFSPRDSALYAWAARASSPVDAIGFTLAPSARGAASLDARMAAADRWIRAARSAKPHWVLEAAGLPTIHGDRSQERALWGALTWATRHAEIKGVVVVEASDYEASLGLRAPGGRVRPAAGVLERGIRALREAGTAAAATATATR